MNKKSLATCAILSFSMMNCMDSSGTKENGISNPDASGQSENIQHLQNEVFVKAENIVLEKGMNIPKGTFILKADETEEGYKSSSSG